MPLNSTLYAKYPMAPANTEVDGASALFKDSLAQRILAIPGFASTPDDIITDDSESLDDFVSFLASETWPIIPERLKNLSPPSTSSASEREEFLAYVDSDEFSHVLDSTPMSFIDTLTSISSMEEDDIRDFLRRVTSDYVSTALTPLPIWSKTRTKECEICEREVPLTYHHLIPRETHDKVKKRGWHPEEMLNSVAWLCR